jgi:hypothetical protein
MDGDDSRTNRAAMANRLAAPNRPHPNPCPGEIVQLIGKI